MGMDKYSKEFVSNWCQQHGWTDLFIERYRYWAFPPGAVMPLPVPAQALQELGDARSWGLKETLWYGGAIALTILAAPLSYFSHCPMPLMFAFAFGAIAVGLMEDAAET